MDEDLSLRIARLRLPLPLEPLVYRALGADNADGRHKRLTFAWEVTCRIAASAAWAACARFALRSPEFDAHCATLDRASFGRWVGLLRSARALLETRDEPEALALAAALRGLDAPFAESPGLAALAERMRALGPARCPVPGRTVGDLLQALPAYRNADAHGDLSPAFRAESVEPLLLGLLDFCERVPPAGVYAPCVVARLERDERGWHVGLVSMVGSHPVVRARTVDREAWENLSRGRAYLFAEPALFLPLEPVASADEAGGAWRLGWLDRRVRGLTLGYDSHVAGAFQRALSADEHARLFPPEGSASADEGASESLLALSPYRGLLAYDEASAPIFFGREEEIARAVARVEAQGALLLCGASGSGKSSLMHAGVVPALRARTEAAGATLRVVSLVPGARPLESLRRALRSAEMPTAAEAAAWSRAVSECLPEQDGPPRDALGLAHLLRGLGAGGARVLLCVDQLEEAGTLCADASERRAFLDALCAAARAAGEGHGGEGAWVLATVRVDLLAGLLDHPGVRELVESRLFPVAAMERARLARVILSPLRGRKVEVEPGLPEEILGDVGEQPGSLALLSQVLATLWETRGRFGYRLTRRGYDAAGRVSGALRVQADAALREAVGEGGEGGEGEARAPERAKLLDRCLLQLASANEEGGFSRRRVRLETLAEAVGAPADEVRARLEPFVRRRLLVTGAAGESHAGVETVEVAHEALLGAWDHLDRLLRLQVEVLRVRQAVESAAAAWEQSGRRMELWSDATSRLARAEELRDAGLLQLTTLERLFLLRSRAAVVRRQRLDRAAVAVFVTLSAAAGVGWAGTIRAQRTLQDTLERERVEAVAAAEQRRAEGDIATARDRAAARGANASALARQPGFEKEALASAIEAVAGPLPPGADLPAAAVQGLIDAVELSGPLSGTLAGHSRALTAAGFSPDGTRAVTASGDQTARVWEPRSGNLFFSLPHPDAVVDASYAPDGGAILTLCADGRARLWQPDGRPLRTLGEADPPARAARFAPGGATVLAAGDDGRARAYEVATGATRYVLPDASARGMAFSLDGARLVTGGSSPALWDAATGRRVASLRAHPAPVCAAAFSPGGERVLTAAEDGSLRLWDARSGRLLASQPGHEGAACAAAFAPSGGRAATGGDDGTARVWDGETLAPLGVLRGHAGPVRALAFAPDGAHLLTGGDDEAARYWDVRTARGITLEGHTGPVRAVALSRDGALAITASQDQTARVWDVAPRRGVLRLEPGAPVQSARYSPDGARVVTADDGGAVRVWDARTGRALAAYAGHAGAVISAVFAPGRGVLSAGADGTARLWREGEGEGEGEVLYTARAALLSAAVSNDGAHALLGGGDGAVTLLDLAGGRAPEALLAGNDPVLSVAFARDGADWVSAGADPVPRVGRLGERERTRFLVGHTGWVFRAEFSPDGARLVTAGADRRARIWDAARGRAERALDGGAGQVFAATFSPDGRRVLTANAARVAQVFDAATGELVFRVPGHAGAVYSACYSPDGTEFLTAGADGTARSHPADTRGYLALACAMLAPWPEADRVREPCAGAAPGR